MRVLLSIVVAVFVAYMIYQYSLKQLPVSDAGTAPTQAISLAGVRGDLLSIAQAERGNMALNSQCLKLDELVSSGAMSMSRPGREGYSYEVTCRGAADFEIVARHAPAPEGSPIRYPTLAIDSSMQVHEIQ